MLEITHVTQQIHTLVLAFEYNPLPRAQLRTKDPDPASDPTQGPYSSLAIRPQACVSAQPWNHIRVQCKPQSSVQTPEPRLNLSSF